jgi:hypothetical protein
MQRNEPQTLSSEKHFGSCNLVRIPNIWYNSVGSKCGPNWAPNITLNWLESIYIESGFTFSFGIVN